MGLLTIYKLSPADSARIKCSMPDCERQAVYGENKGTAPFWYHCEEHVTKDKPIAAKCAMTVPLENAAGRGFVKGPWEVIDKGTSLRVKQKNDGDWYQGLICSFHKPLMDVDYANARLIAAAPDLLEALQRVHTWLICPDTTAETIAAIRATAADAIAKATRP